MFFLVGSFVAWIVLRNRLDKYTEIAAGSVTGSAIPGDSVAPASSVRSNDPTSDAKNVVKKSVYDRPWWETILQGN
jgi:hypothetical protein